MAIFDDIFKGIGGPAALGVGALLLAPRLLPMLRPVAKEIVKNAYIYTDPKASDDEREKAIANAKAALKIREAIEDPNVGMVRKQLVEWKAERGA